MASYSFLLVPRDDLIAQIRLFFSRMVHMPDMIVQMIQFFDMLYLRVFWRTGDTGIFYMTCTSPRDLVGGNCVYHHVQYIKSKGHMKNGLVDERPSTQSQP